MLFASLILAAVSTLGYTAAAPLSKRQLWLPEPSEDPFYDAPDNLESLSNGEVYDSRTVHLGLEYLEANEVMQVAYRTTNMWGDASYTIATVFTPKSPDSDAKLLSLQIAEDAANIDCAPSYYIYEGFQNTDGVPIVGQDAIYIDWALRQGYYVVAPDHEGAQSTFLAGFNEGRAGLDGVRAALSQLSLDSETPVAFVGYSGGAHATVWMTEIAADYAPDLNIIGAAHGGTPIDPRGTMQHLDGTSFSGFVVGALAGLLKAYPVQAELVYEKLDEQLKDDIQTAYSSNVCLSKELSLFKDMDVSQMTHFRSFFRDPAIDDILDGESLLMNVSTHSIAVPKFPRYMWHGYNDEIIPFDFANQYVEQQCDSGANIQFVKWPNGGHATLEYLGIGNSIQFIGQAFDGSTPDIQCGSAPPDALSPVDKIGGFIGQLVQDAINALNGTSTPLGEIILH